MNQLNKHRLLWVFHRISGSNTDIVALVGEEIDLEFHRKINYKGTTDI